jgi:hypothetical protein
MSKIDWAVVDTHLQKFRYSCIPSAVEIVLKVSGKAKPDYYELQNKWDNKEIGSFKDFDGRKIQGVVFKLENGFASLDSLFDTISKELMENRFVIISLKSKLIDSRDQSDNCHMCVIYDSSIKEKEFKAFTKNWGETKLIDNVKQIVEKMGTTDILTYTEIPPKE